MKTTQTGVITTIDTERFKSCVFVRFTINRWGNRAKVTDQAALVAYLTKAKAEQDEAAKDGTKASETPTAAIAGKGVSTTKRLMQSPALDELNEFLTETKNAVLRLCNPSQIMPGLVVTSAENYARINDMLESAVADLQLKYRPAFIADFPAAIERARTAKIKDGGLGPLFVASDYGDPEKAADCFGLKWFPVSLKVPDNIPQELRAEAAAKMDKQMTDAAEAVQQALREGMAELVKHASDCLQPTEDGKKRIFRDSLLGNIQDFCDCFSARNIMNDEALAALVDKARAVITGIQGKPGQKAADALRTNDELRAKTREQFAAIAAQLDTMIQTEERDFAFDE